MDSQSDLSVLSCCFWKMDMRFLPSSQKKAYLLEKNMHKEGILKVLEMAKADRAAGKQVLVINMKKNKKFQKDQLIAEGYEDITDCYKDSVMDL